MGYGQGVVQPAGMFATVLAIDGVKAKVKVHVVPQESREVYLIVGDPYTKQEHVAIISKANELLIESDEKKAVEK